jgi:hypothetical protein
MPSGTSHSRSLPTLPAIRAVIIRSGADVLALLARQAQIEPHVCVRLLSVSIGVGRRFYKEFAVFPL